MPGTLRVLVEGFQKNAEEAVEAALRAVLPQLHAVTLLSKVPPGKDHRLHIDLVVLALDVGDYAAHLTNVQELAFSIRENAQLLLVEKEASQQDAISGNFGNGQNVDRIVAQLRENRRATLHYFNVEELPSLLLAIFQTLHTAITQAEQEAVRQGPAPYNFGDDGQQIRLLPNQSAPWDSQLAEDLFEGVCQKIRRLIGELGGNVHPGVKDDLQKFSSLIEKGFETLRPGVLLSQVLSLEADELILRDEQLMTSVARLSDVTQTCRQLLSCFAAYRELERESLALKLDAHPDDIVDTLQADVAVVVNAVQNTAPVAQEAAEALRLGQNAVASSKNKSEKNSQLALQLLTVRNFFSASAAWMLRSKPYLGRSLDAADNLTTAAASLAALVYPDPKLFEIISAIRVPVTLLRSLLRKDS